MTKFADLKVLLVDPNHSMRSIVQTLLHGGGIHNIINAQDATEALEKFTLSKLDVIITEWKMPIIDGGEFIRTIRHDRRDGRNHIPIMVLTADSRRQTIFAARDAGAHTVMCKPVSSQALCAHIKDIVFTPREFIEVLSYTGPDRRFFTSYNFGTDRRKSEETVDILD